MDTQAPSPDAKFRSLVLAIRSGCRVDMSEIAGILAVSGRSYRDLVAALTARPRTVQPGDRCGKCGDRLVVYCTRSAPGRRTQYLRCKGCGARPEHNKRSFVLAK
ncbi:MAG: hypothetical protein ACOX1P_15785 [Thermoguttaceae bacterium]|jgi:DNA-directed RNA polymerase subunit M/transcription elongation factor TFIIS